MLIIPRELLQIIVAHGWRCCPDECCGLLSGKYEGDRRVVLAVYEAENTIAAPARDRYAIDPLQYAKLEKSLQSRGRVVVGFYHSHPGSPPLPSAFDLDAAWPTESLSHLIVSLQEDGSPLWKSWVWHPDGPTLREEQVEIA